MERYACYTRRLVVHKPLGNAIRIRLRATSPLSSRRHILWDRISDISSPRPPDKPNLGGVGRSVLMKRRKDR